jgi:glycine oxidase
VIIVGAGIIGLSCAWKLAKEGRKVTVLDAREPASEASWAAAGMLSPGGECETAEAAELSLASLRAFPEYLRELEADSGVSVWYRQTGAIEVALDDAEWAALEEKAARQAKFGIESEKCEWRGDRARFYPADVVLDPREINRALLSAVKRLGVEVRAGEAVCAIAPDGHSVETARGRLTGDGVLIAAGAWSSQLFPGLPRTYPVKGHLVAWKLQPGLLDTIVRRPLTYVVQRPDGTMIGGTTAEQVGFDRALDADLLRGIRERTARLLPELAGYEPETCWNGFRPAIEAEGPMIGKLDGVPVWTAFGHYRNGILLAPETAKRIAEAVALN